ncbi:penicillin-binding protein 2 [Glutamicibacter sp. JC586]|uniref:peptidoglycan D,D-transpeptidase FtsI family protein n=1 Tax=Glutamicibacter sp. JC586 TaxID=2590552 RepID=UPI0013578C3C|nr:penicillin-binding transpeptidase domain-containing protein [Glutamicibacter sp. JC586]
MNQAIKRVWIALTMLFVICLGGLSYIQFFDADKLTDNALNKRQLYREFDLPRGAILVDGKPIAESVPTDDGQFEYQREYTNAEMYAHLTGYYSLANGTTQLESSLNDWLTGKSSDLLYDRLLAMFTGKKTEGASVELTIDGDLQKTAFNAIPDGVKATVIVTDPKTGDILAMVSKPTYDTNLLAVHSTSKAAENLKKVSKIDGLSPYLNPAISDLNFPGSSFKILSTVAALESGKYDLDTTIDNPSSVRYKNSTRSMNNFGEGVCAREPRAKLAFIFAQSCNTPFYGISKTVGAKAFGDVAERFGFGQQLNIPQRVTPSQFPSDGADEAELARMAIGQGSNKVTALQMNMAAMAIANDGVIMKPNMIDKVIAPDLRVIEEPKPEKFSTATSKEVASDLKELMEGPVTRGTAMNAAVPGVDFRAKTGTAQLYQEGGVSYVNSWMTGFAPADDPQVAITVTLQDVDYDTGHNTTGAIMKKMLKAVFNK